MKTALSAASAILTLNTPATIPAWPIYAYRRVALSLRHAFGKKIMTKQDSIFFTESFSGSRQQRRYTLELFKESDNSYRLVQRRYNQELGVLDEDKHTLAANIDELMSMNLGNSRLVKQLRRSEWWVSHES